MKNLNLLKVINTDWGNNVGEINANKKLMLVLYRFLKRKFLNKDIDENVLCLAICFLENTNILFHSDARYEYYQDISCGLFKRFNEIKNLGSKKLFYRFCLAGVYSDYFINNDKQRLVYEKSLLDGLSYFKPSSQKTDIEQNIIYYFLGLIHVSQYYLFIGDIARNQFFLEEAMLHIKKNPVLNSNYKAFFYYHYSWSFFEMRDFKKALVIINNLLKLKYCVVSEPIILHALNIKCSILYALGKYNDCLKLAKIVSRDSQRIFSLNNQNVYAESLLNIAKCLLKKNGDLFKAQDNARNAILILNNLFSGSNIDASQALANIILGETYEKSGNITRALYVCFLENCITEQNKYVKTYQSAIFVI